MEFRIFRKETTESTNLDARAGVHGDVFTARAQTAGRGRLDHRWLARPGENLTFSAVLSVADLPPDEVMTLPLVAGLAVRRVTGGAVKWPNDVLVDGRKIAGILCERNGDNVICGIGVNVNQTVFPAEIAARATSLKLVRGDAQDLDAVLAAVLAELGALYETWRAGGFAAVYAELAAHDALKGAVVSVRQTDGDPAPVEGLCGGIRADGALLVAGRPVFAGEAVRTVPV